MSLKKSILSGKERRREYNGSKRFSKSCRNHGSCTYCEENRTYFDKRARFSADEELKEPIEEYGYEENEDKHIEIEKELDLLNEINMSKEYQKPKAGLKEFFDSCLTTAEISYLGGKYDSGILNGENELETTIEGTPCFIISWSEKGRGFGEYTFYYKDRKWRLDSEHDSKETVKRILSILVDSIELEK
jgi:hypothetical protein